MKTLNMYEIISKKRDNQKLDKKELEFVINGYTKGDIPDYQISALLMAIYFNGLDHYEMEWLTKLMLLSGGTIDLSNISGKKIDKHSTGGVGDKVSFIVSPLVAACGVKVPMLSGRALGHTGGTLDKLESIPGMNVFLTKDEFKETLEKTGMAICGQTDDIVPADKKLYALRDSTATVNSIPLISSSIMSKKLALLSDGIVLDIKTGRGAFLPSLDDSKKLCKTMVGIGEMNGRKTLGLITAMDQPLGNSVGNSLEIIESIECLKGNGPDDLMEVTYAVGSAMLVAAGKFDDLNNAADALKSAIKSGTGLDIFRKFIKYQGGNEKVCEDYNMFEKSKNVIELRADQEGYISLIDAYEVGMAAIDIGAGRRSKEDSIDHSAGFVFNSKEGDFVEKDGLILTVHTNLSENIDAVILRLKNSIKIVSNRVKTPERVLFFADKSGLFKWRDLF